MKDLKASPWAMIYSIWCNRNLILQMVKREVIGRYRGSVLGLMWSFFNPILMLSVYTFVFGIIFKSRWRVGSSSKAEFALVLFSGLIIYNLFAECINRAPSLIISNVNYVKKVIFPLEILPWVAFGSALFHMIVSLLVWILFYILAYGIPPASFALFPIVLFPLMFLTMGLSWFLASIGTYLRDVGQIVGFLVMALLFLSPIFFPMSAIPVQYRNFIYVNPLSVIIEGARNVMMWGMPPAWFPFIIITAVSLFMAWLGFAWFQKTRKGFGDVL